LRDAQRGRQTNDIAAKSGLDAPTNLQVPLTIPDGLCLSKRAILKWQTKRNFNEIFLRIAVCFTFGSARRRAANRRGPRYWNSDLQILVAANQGQKQFSLQAAQWILGNLTGYFRQAADDPSRTLSDDVLVKTVMDVCAHNAEKTIDEAVSIAVSSLPTTEIPKPVSK
jgi:hypothetical protein